MAEVNALRQGAADVLGTLPGVNAYPYVPGSLTPPAAIVGPPVVVYEPAIDRGIHEFEFSVWLVVAHGSDRHAQALVDEFLSSDGPRSVLAAVIADHTLGGAVDDCKITRAEPVDLTPPNGPVYLAAEFSLTALAKRI